MFPIGDDDSGRRTTPVVTFALIALNILVFFIELNGGDAFIKQWAFIPSRFSSNPVSDASTVFTAMFMHGGWLHLFGNMLYLWIFGDNLERVMGRARYAAFYLICGLAAGAAHIAFNSGSRIPSVGASGAISGVLGGYLLLFPRNRVRVMTGRGVAAVPAWATLGLWIVIQLVNGFGSMANTDETSGVAYMAHIGGFVAGLALVKVFASGRGRARPAYV